MEFTLTSKGHRKIICDNFMYTYQKDLANDVQSWECVLRKSGQCKAKVKLTATGDFIELTAEHTHPADPTKCEVAKVNVGIKRKAETTQDKAQQILAVELQRISESAVVNMASLNSIRRNIRHIRQDKNPLSNPQSRDQIPVLPQEYQNTGTGEQFLIFDSGVGDQERIFIFGTQQELQLLGQSDDWYADGAFKVCPDIFYQVYTIHAQVNGQILPCLFALLPNKQQATYNRFFREVRNLIPNFGNGPTSILVDFEKAAINALTAQIPQTDVSSCFYHLSSNVWKHIQEYGLQVQYNNDANFALHMRMIAALAFVPPNDVIASFDLLVAEIRQNFNGVADDLLEYFEDTYIGRFRRNLPRRAAMFGIELWNMFHRTDGELPRTNNSVEGWHRAFQCNLSACHPTFWKFLDVLKEEEGIIRVKVLQCLGGHLPPPQRRRYAECGERILRILNDYPNRQRVLYLRAIAHNLSY